MSIRSDKIIAIEEEIAKISRAIKSIRGIGPSDIVYLSFIKNKDKFNVPLPREEVVSILRAQIKPLDALRDKLRTELNKL